MSTCHKQNAEGQYFVRTTSRRVGKVTRTSSQTRGKEKGGNCVREELKTWGMRANPYKLRGGELSRYEKYCQMTSGMNK